MGPRKFASFNDKARPAGGRMASFRDDTGLVALRYEQTKQAEPPIPFPPPRNPLRGVVGGGVNGGVRPRSTATTTSASISPIVIPPPETAPPREQHPFFRSQSTPQTATTRADSWKRDSGLAPTSSSVTIRVDCDEDNSFLHEKIVDSPVREINSPTRELHSPVREMNSPVRELHSPVRDMNSPVRELHSPVKELNSPVREVHSPVRELHSPASEVHSFVSGDEKVVVAPTRKRPPIPPPLPELSIVESVSTQDPEPIPPPTRTNSASKRLAKAFGMRSSNSTKRLKKRGGGGSSQDEKVTSLASAWGSLKSGPVSPKSTPITAPSSPPPTREPPTPPQRPPRPDSLQLLSPLRMEPFSPITTPIPTDSLLDEELAQLSFSKRGSIMFGGKRPANQGGAGNASSSGKDNGHHHHHRPQIPNIRLLSVDVERDSQKVRSLYDSGESLDWREGGRVAPAIAALPAPAEDAPTTDEGGENVVPPSHQHPQESPLTTPAPDSPRSASLSQRRDNSPRREYELAGGLEDWEDVDGADVDRFGFIRPPREPPEASSKGEDAEDDEGSEAAGLRPESAAALPQLAPLPMRKRTVFFNKRPGSSNSPSGLAPARERGRKIAARSLNTQASEFSTASRRSTRLTIRHAANRLPHNRERRWMDEAGEMLSLAPGLGDIAEDEHAEKLSQASKRKEWERSEKWVKMAKVVRRGKDGEGMDFEFDTKNQKLIDRTWKGIPDRWRSAAWYSFLAASARSRKGSETDEFLAAEFRRLQDTSSPDDVQIDLDVPRTVNRHIMFRARYRGGQRLLFRVLHAISLYFPDTGYVQGMASLAATLLCYYDEEKCFIMLVRMWRYRGLEKLYEPGFGGLMDALKDLETLWLVGRAPARKLSELSIDATAYGTRWYLTLFNLSIPFAAQLRVWDVFMLLGEADPTPPATSGSSGSTSEPAKSNGNLDILHATSAALMDALQEVLLDSDFENAMKALTSWIPVKDEEMLMKVTRAEWKRHQGKRKG